MAHNYARPLTPEARLTRLLARIPSDWEVKADRASHGQWRVWMEAEGRPGQWSSPADNLVDAMEDVWRLVR